MIPVSPVRPTMTLPDFLWADKFGEIIIHGHRITLYHVVTRFQEGYSADEILDLYPTLEPPLVYKVLAFYLENRAEMDEYVRTTREEIDRQERETPRGPTLEELKRRLAARTLAAGA
jgi:uncharacterized protein (DUF433 family)